MMISAVAVFLFAILLFNFEKITGSAVKMSSPAISLSSDGEIFFENPKGNTVTVDAGSMLYVKLSPAENNKRIFIYDSRHSSRAGTFETNCLERKGSGSKCTSSLATYKTPVDVWANGVYTIKVAGVSGKAEFTLQNSNYGG